MAKNYFAIVHKETGKMLVTDGKLPIYWYKGNATEMAKIHPGYIVQPVDIEKMERLVLSQPNPKAI